jgi:hypothetical protein
MGVKSFTQVFEYSNEVKLKDLKGKNIVIDASVEVYRASLGMKMSETLTDAFGQPTAHINTILLGVILKLKAAGINQFWVFDKFHEAGEECHNPLKQLELQKRKEKKVAAAKKVVELKDKIAALNITKVKTEEDELFSESEGEEPTKDDKSDQITKHKENLDKQEKIAFKMKQSYFDDVIFMLDMLNIPWLESCRGFDAEQICAEATNKNLFGVRMDYVLSSDSDVLIFGAKLLIKRDIRKKKFFKYNLAELLEKYELEQDDLIKVALILGTDFAPKTKGVGPKTILKKYKSITLSEEQQKAMDQNFKRKLTAAEIKDIIINNQNSVPFTDGDKFNQLLDWIQLVKNFNRERILKQFHKQELFTDIE